MKVLFISAESAPFSKTGGLGDVAIALPKELRKKDVDVRVMIPKDFDLPPELAEQEKQIFGTTFRLGWRYQYIGISSLEYDGVTFYFLENNQYFKRGGLYGHFDDGERFSWFSKGALEAIKYIDFAPDVIHANDWHTAMIPLLLKKQYQEDELYKNIRTVFTIHNLKYQGIFDRTMLADMFELDDSPYDDGSIRFFGNINFMKAGINYADKITTVSSTYAEEILDPYFGEYLDYELNLRKGDLSGITNGLDYEFFDPATDKFIFQNYDSKHLEQRTENKVKMQEMLGLAVNPDVPLVAIISRLTDMKGLDLIEHVIHEIFELDLQVVVLGKGDTHYENMFKYYAQRYPDRMRVFMEFNAPLAQKIYAGSDMLLMPSRIEPCGLGQIIALRYGCLPVVRETGGLRDTVTPYNEFTGEGNGFSFSNYNAHDMLFKLKEALEIYKDKATWLKLAEQAMDTDHSWNKSADQYLDLYRDLVKGR